MTLQQIQQSDKDFLIPADVAEVLGCHPYAINVQANEDASKLGFPVSLIGTRVKIPRLGFLHWMTYGNAPIGGDDLKGRNKNVKSANDSP